MKERLIELFREADKRCKNNENCRSCIGYDKGANCQHHLRIELLIERGALFPPVKIGQELWDIHYNRPRKWEVVYLGYNGKEWHINIHWWKDRHNFKTLSITYPFVGKMWYLSKEEAEQKLKGGADNG